MEHVILEPPRSVVLALWLAAMGSGADPVRRAVRSVQGDDEPHTVAGAQDVADGGTLDELVAAWGGGERSAAAVLPVPGDLSGVPAAVSDLALDAGECVLVHVAGRSWAAVPDVVTFGPPQDEGHLVTWQVRAVPDWRASLPGVVGTLAEAEQSMRHALIEAAQALADLDVARWRPDAADAIASLRSTADPGWALPPDVGARTVRVLATATRLRAVVELATADDGGAINLWQADQRSAALRHVDHAARRAIAAATTTSLPTGRS